MPKGRGHGSGARGHLPISGSGAKSGCLEWLAVLFLIVTVLGCVGLLLFIQSRHGG